MQDQPTFQRYLTVEEERQLLRALASRSGVLARRDSAWMRLMRQTGIRVGALSGLTVFDAREALRLGHLALRDEISKGARGYQVYLNRKARAALHDLLRARREMGHAEIPEHPLVMSRNHQGMSVRSFQARMDMWVRSAGLAVHATPHWWRHTLGRRVMCQSTARDPRAIAQAALGHASINSTAIYTRPGREDIAQAMEEAA